MATQQYNIFDLGLDQAMNRQSLLSFQPTDTSTPVGALSSVIPGSIRPESFSSGELPSITYVAKMSFTDTANGMRQGLDSDGTYKWIIGTTGNSVDFNVTTANTLTISGALSASTIDIGGADATSFHVDIDGNMWLGAATYAAATAFRVSNAGVLTSISGTIAAFTLAATTISATNLTLTSGAANTANITVGTGATAGGINSANAAGDIIFWGGSTFANRATAPFRVEADGSVVATDATITGSVTATSGAIGGWTINATSITDAAGVVGMSSAVTGGDDIRFWAGDATPGSAEFRVTEAGALTASSATITGSVTATSGAIGGFDIGSDYIRDVADSFGLASTVTGGDDVRFWAGDTFANRATADFRVTEAGAVTASSMTITGGSITSTSLSGIPNSTATDISLLEKSHDLVFSVTDADTIAWGAGTIAFSNGRTFAIDAGNTGNMAALTYIYLDTGVSSTVLQTTTTYSTAMGANKSLLGMAQNNTVTAMFIPYGAGQPLIDGANIGALSIVAGNIAASTITAGKLSVTQLSAITADLGTITAGTVTGATIRTAASGARVVLNATGIEGHDATTQRFDVSNDGSGWLGTSTAIAWTTAGALTINGSAVATVQTRAEQLNTEFVFLGGQDDGLTASASGTASITRRPITTYFALGANDGAELRATAIGTKTDGNNLDWDDDYEFSIVAQTNVASGFESVVFEITGTLNGNPGTQTQRHIGFYFDDGTVYASNANGTTETRTDISGSVTKTNRTQYRFVYDAGVNILFYINDVLVATHTTNLPSGTTTPPQFYLAALTGLAEAVQVVLCNNYFLKVIL